MNRALLLGVVVLAGCAHATGAPAPGSPGAATGRSPAPPREVTAAAMLERAPGDSEVLLRLSLARAHPLGAKLDPFILAWPGWGKTLRRLTTHPVAELDWIDVVGPHATDLQRLAAHPVAADAAVDAALASTGDGSLRIVARVSPHLVLAAPPGDAPAATRAALAAEKVTLPGEPLDAIYVDMAQPHATFRTLPVEARHAVLRVRGGPAGSAVATLDLDCDDAPAAHRVAQALEEQADRTNGTMVKILTRDLLGGLTSTVDGSTAHLRLPASSEQLESLATLAGAMIPPE